MKESVHARLDQIPRVGQVIDVGHHAQVVFVRFVDDRPIERRAQLLHGAVAIVDPDFQEVRFPRGQLPDVAASLVFGRDAVGYGAHRGVAG